jgi:hypothetical protein
MGQALAAVERMWGVAIVNFAWAGAFIVATLTFVDRGAVGLALARLFAQGIYLIGIVWLYQRHVAPKAAVS